MFASISEINEFHADLDKENALQSVIALAQLEDIECQEYAAFSLAHLASNKDYQVRLVNLGAVRPLVSMLASDAEPRHYAGLALLKLADNFENHLRIAEEGGIQALLRLGRARSSDEQVQYKAAITVGQLASNAVKMFPSKGSGPATGGLQPAESEIGNGSIGTSAKMLDRLRGQVDAQKGKVMTKEYFEKSSASAPSEIPSLAKTNVSQEGSEKSNNADELNPSQTFPQAQAQGSATSELNEEMARTEEIN